MVVKGGLNLLPNFFMKVDSNYTQLPILLFAISNTLRIKILNYCDKERTIYEIAKHVGRAKSTIYVHVNALVEAKLLGVERGGRRVKVYKRKQEEVRLCFTNSDSPLHP